jgi:hypothetical protein
MILKHICPSLSVSAVKTRSMLQPQVFYVSAYCSQLSDLDITMTAITSGKQEKNLFDLADLLS